MTEVSLGPVGFWCYVHLDDDATSGQILRLAKRIKDEFSLLTGEML